MSEIIMSDTYNLLSGTRGALNNEKIEKVNILGHVVMPILRQIACMYLLFSISATIVSSWYMVDWGIR